VAPFIGPDRDELLRLLSAARPTLPITLGHYQPMASVTCDDGVWRITTLTIDDDQARRAGAAAIAAGQNWMPEMEWQFLRPHRVLVEAKSKDDFLVKIRAMKWKFSR